MSDSKLPVVIRYDALDKWTANETTEIAGRVAHCIAGHRGGLDPLAMLIAQMAVEEPDLNIEWEITGPTIAEGYSNWYAVNGYLFIGRISGPSDRTWFSDVDRGLDLAEDCRDLDQRPYDRGILPVPMNVPFLHAVFIDILHKRTLARWKRDRPKKVAAEQAFYRVIDNGGAVLDAFAARLSAIAKYDTEHPRTE